MRVLCTIEETELENDEGRTVDGVEATCSRCEHTTESYGTDTPSRRRCLVLLREECPMGEHNFYVDEEDD
jgi:hypothetical protein